MPRRILVLERPRQVWNHGGMLLSAASRLRFSNSGPVVMVLMLRPRSGEGQWVKAETYMVTPAPLLTEYTDLYGNLCQRIVAGEGELFIEARCEVEVPEAADSAPGLGATLVEALPTEVLHYLLPSRYCESDRLYDAALEIAADAAPGYDQAQRITQWIHDNVAYQPGTTNATTSAVETWSQRAGVCRDQAHLGVALCRALSLPSRMVVGYLENLEPMDLHAWFECYIGGRWWTFDPKEASTTGGRIVLGTGRDAADVALATQFGPSELLSLQVTVERIENLDRLAATP